MPPPCRSPLRRRASQRTPLVFFLPRVESWALSKARMRREDLADGGGWFRALTDSSGGGGGGGGGGGQPGSARHSGLLSPTSAYKAGAASPVGASPGHRGFLVAPSPFRYRTVQYRTARLSHLCALGLWRTRGWVMRQPCLLPRRLWRSSAATSHSAAAPPLPPPPPLQRPAPTGGSGWAHASRGPRPAQRHPDAPPAAGAAPGGCPASPGAAAWHRGVRGA